MKCTVLVLVPSALIAVLLITMARILIIKVNPVENIIAANAASDCSMQKLTPSLTYEKFQSDETWKNRELHIKSNGNGGGLSGSGSSWSDGGGEKGNGTGSSSKSNSSWFTSSSGGENVDDNDGGGRGKRGDVRGVIALVLTIVGIIFIALGLRNLLQNRDEEGKEEEIDQYGIMSDDSSKSGKTEDENEQESEIEEEEEDDAVKLTSQHNHKKVRKWRQKFSKFRSARILRSSKTTTSLKDQDYLPENV